jgi:hypothetical protein
VPQRDGELSTAVEAAQDFVAASRSNRTLPQMADSPVKHALSDSENSVAKAGKAPLKAPGSIMQILVGPHAPRNAEKMVSDFLKVQGYPDGIAVRRSSAIV